MGSVSVLFNTAGELVSCDKLVERLYPYRDYESSPHASPHRQSEAYIFKHYQLKLNSGYAWTVCSVLQSQFECCWLRGCIQEGDVEPTQCVQGWVFSDVASGKTSCSGGAVVVWSSPELFALFAKVAKFVVCRNNFLRFLFIS